MKFKAKIESIELQKDSEYQRIAFNNLIIEEPEVLHDLFHIMNTQRYVKIEFEE